MFNNRESLKKKLQIEIEKFEQYRDKLIIEIDNLKNQKTELSNQLLDYKHQVHDEIFKLAKICADDTKKYEHIYHQNMETLKCELAELEAKKAVFDNDRIVYERMLKEKDKEIDRLNNICQQLIKECNKGHNCCNDDKNNNYRVSGRT